MSDFSHSGFTLHPELRDKTKPVSTEWLRGPKISKENLKKGTGCIELCARPDWVKIPNQPVGGKTQGFSKPAQNPAVIGFGKFKGRLFCDILEENPGYLKWCCSEIDGFEAKLRKAGINPDEI